MASSVIPPLPVAQPASRTPAATMLDVKNVFIVISFSRTISFAIKVSERILIRRSVRFNVRLACSTFQLRANPGCSFLRQYFAFSLEQGVQGISMGVSLFVPKRKCPFHDLIFQLHTFIRWQIRQVGNWFRGGLHAFLFPRLMNLMSLSRNLESTDRNERNLFIMFIAGHSGGVRIKHWFAIHQKPVLMMAMT